MALRAVPEHPKFADLKNILQLRKYHALGILESLWHFTGKFCPQGNIGKFNDAAIEAWVEWDGKRGVLIAALIESGWIDKSNEHRLVVHDWHEHADQTTRKQLGRTKKGFVQDTSQTCPIPIEPKNTDIDETYAVHVPDMSGQSRDMSSDLGKVSGPPEPVPVPEPEPAPVPEPSTLALTSVEVPAGVFELPLPGNQGEWSLPQKLYDELQLAYPDLGIMGELSKMRIWLIANPSRRKTAKGLPKFINNWLSGKQNSPRNTGGNTHGTTYSKPSKIDQIRESHRNALARLEGMGNETNFFDGDPEARPGAGRLLEDVHSKNVAGDPIGDW